MTSLENKEDIHRFKDFNLQKCHLKYHFPAFLRITKNNDLQSLMNVWKSLIFNGNQTLGLAIILSKRLHAVYVEKQHSREINVWM